MYHIYMLKDYKGYYFYIGITKNLEIRIREHTMNKNASPAKTYRVRRCIEVHGSLQYDVRSANTLEEAREIEAKLIKEYQHQLVNCLHGKVTKSDKQIRSKGRSIQCEKCGNWFKVLARHRCKI